MRKFFIYGGIIASILILGSIIVYYYLAVERRIKVYEKIEEIYSERETTGKAWAIIDSEDVRIRMEELYEIKLPKNNFSENYLLISDGREIKEIKYKIINKFEAHRRNPLGTAVFDEKYYPHKIFVYKIEKKYVRSPE